MVLDQPLNLIGRQEPQKQRQGAVRLREGMVGKAGVGRVGRQARALPLQADPPAVVQEEAAQGLRAHMTQVRSNIGFCLCV